MYESFYFLKILLEYTILFAAIHCQPARKTRWLHKKGYSQVQNVMKYNFYDMEHILIIILNNLIIHSLVSFVYTVVSPKTFLWRFMLEMYFTCHVNVFLCDECGEYSVIVGSTETFLSKDCTPDGGCFRMIEVTTFIVCFQDVEVRFCQHSPLQRSTFTLVLGCVQFSTCKSLPCKTFERPDILIVPL